ncbi:hypothetical protein MRX96_024298 [Rhipicephalus microplus]
MGSNFAGCIKANASLSPYVLRLVTSVTIVPSAVTDELAEECSLPSRSCGRRQVEHDEKLGSLRASFSLIVVRCAGSIVGGRPRSRPDAGHIHHHERDSGGQNVAARSDLGCRGH